MKLGIIGLPNVGKSTLFNALTKAGALSANYPFTTIEPNVGTVAVPDQRLSILAKMLGLNKTVPASIEFVDIAGLVRGSSRGEGLGNKFLSHIREVDAVVHVVRCFEDPNVSHVDGTVDPARDIETIRLELIFADIEMLEKRIEKAARLIKVGEKEYQSRLDLYKHIMDGLLSNKTVRSLDLDDDQKELVSDIFFLTSKPVIYVSNISEKDILASDENEMVLAVKNIAAAEDTEAIVICAGIEEEIASLDDTEQKEFLAELGLRESGLDKLIKASYTLLDLISFITANDKEVRAWPIINGTHAVKAAGKVHTDFEKGFIRADVTPFAQLIPCGSFSAAKEKGLVRSEGRDYIMRDGDVVLFRFNV
ncbi:MAG: redox-regulated ATPase YchF [Eubacteriales bacterium]|nr:redox-regulated ATPase YchF [Eubacteriales bacterium]